MAEFKSSSLLQRLRDREAALPLAQQRVVACVLSDPERAVGCTVEQLAQWAGVSMPTIVRTFRTFGHGSVRGFLLALAQDLAVTGSHLHRAVALNDSASDVISKIVHASVSSLTDLGRRIDAAVIEQVVHKLAHAHRIDCYSVGAASTFMANELQSRLFRLGRPAHAIFDAHQQLVSAQTLGPGGVVFVISHVGRMPYTLEATRFARSRGATVVALTQPDTPLAALADLLLEASVPPDAVMRVGTEAYLAHLVMIEILTVRLAQTLGPVATQGLQQFRHLLEQHGFDSAEYAAMSAEPRHHGK
jgi:DNA-binding MurR/RpiR family transcriptional regulator